jgi:hypothetical protein
MQKAYTQPPSHSKYQQLAAAEIDTTTNSRPRERERERERERKKEKELERYKEVGSKGKERMGGGPV